MSKRIWAERSAILMALAGMIAFVATTAGADPRTMTGSILVENPSAGFELQPGVYGRKEGGAGPNIYPPTDGVQSLSVAGTTTSTFVGRSVVLPANKLDRTGFTRNFYPAFANVGQVSKSYMTLQNAATFAENAGALAACPGPGCTTAGTAISWCPPVSHAPASPAPGTAAAHIGNWDCASWLAGAIGGDRFLRMQITNASGRPNFGGTLALLRNVAMNVWRVPVQPSTPNASDAEATRSWMNLSNIPWSGGRSNFAFTPMPGNNGPRLFARLLSNGGIAETYGCANGVGTNGGNYVASNAIIGPGSNCGTNTVAGASGQGWGFKMTTGTVEGSDPYPYGLVVTTTMAPASPFNPNYDPSAQPASLGFFFSRMGTDSITSGGNRNIVMLGGGIAVDPGSGNAFFRITRLDMNLEVPEPATGLGLLAGTSLLAAMVRRRMKR